MDCPHHLVKIILWEANNGSSKAVLKWEKLENICAAEALDLPCHGSGIPHLQLFLGSANSFQPAVAGDGNLGSYPHFFCSQRGVDSLDLGKGLS